MKSSMCLSLILAAIAVSWTAHAAPRATAHYRLGGESLGAGGTASTTPHHSSLGQIGETGGLPTHTPGSGAAANPGYLGSLYEVVSLDLEAHPALVNEDEKFELKATATLHDGTSMALSGMDVAWAVASGPVTLLPGNDAASADPVYLDTQATLLGGYLGLDSNLIVQVLNRDPDNFGLYAGDGLDDAWQVRHFGENNPDADPGKDPDGDGQNNEFEQTAGTGPNDPGSWFELRIVKNPAVAGQVHLVFGPVFPDRDYAVQYRLNLPGAAFAPLEGAIPFDQGTDRIVPDDILGELQKFYRVQISLP
jgi:hypothetical protein